MADGQAQPPIEPYVFQKPKQCWIYGINDHIDVIPDELKAQPTTGVFRRDYEAICQALSVVPHIALRVKPSRADSNATAATEEEENPSGYAEPEEQVDPYSVEETIHLINTLMDTASWRIFSHLLNTSHHVKNIRASDCRIDEEMLQEFRDALCTDKCTLRQLQLDYNPLETSLKCAPWGLDTARMHDMAAEDVAKLDWDRIRLAEYRSLRIFRRTLEDKFGSVRNGFAAMDLDGTQGVSLDEFLSALEVRFLINF